MKNKFLILAAGILCLTGLGIAQTEPAYSATCSHRQVDLVDVHGTSSILIAPGLEYFTVDNPTPFIPGMRVRGLTGTTLNTTKYVEGLVGIVLGCRVGMLIDEHHGSGYLKNARFSVAGIVGLAGPTGSQGASGPIGIQGLQGVPGINGTNGLNGVNGTNGLNGLNGFVPTYGLFRDTTTQAVTTANTPKAMTFNQATPGVNGISAVGIDVVLNSRITVSKTGTYKLTFSAQLSKTDAGNDTMDIWIRKNGVDVPFSNSEITITASQKVVATSTFVIDLVAGDYLELLFSSADTASSLLATAPGVAPVRPEGPSVIVSIEQIQ